MSWLGTVLKLASGWKAYALGAAVVAAAAGGALLWHGAKVSDAHDAAFSAGRLEVQTEALREHQREIARLIDVTNNLNEAYRDQLEILAQAESRAAADARRMRQLTADRAAALSAAAPEAVREYAATAADVFAECRNEYRALGLAADRCSAAAHALDGWADEVSNRPSRPTPPTKPTKP